jgi:hypothetical protein
MQGKEALHMPRLRIDSSSWTSSWMLSVHSVIDSLCWKFFSCDPSGRISVDGGSASFFNSPPGIPAVHLQDPPAFSEEWLMKIAVSGPFRCCLGMVSLSPPLFGRLVPFKNQIKIQKAHFNETWRWSDSGPDPLCGL